VTVTDRLYYDSDSLAFDATVISYDGDDCRVVLDRTAFYPTSGGQPHDTGFLGDVAVIDVVDKGDLVVHLCERSVPQGPVSGAVNAGRRQDFTIQHTAQHVLSALASDRLGWETKSVHFGEARSLIEFEVTDSTEEELISLEDWANTIVAAARPVTIGYEDALSATGLRKASDRDGLLRLVTIDEVDRSACGGTHVTTTAQLGSIMVRGVERMRGRIRVGFLAGPRAMAHSRSTDAMLERLAKAAGAPVGELIGLIPSRLEALKEANKRILKLERELAELRVRALISNASPGPGGVRWVELRLEDQPVTALRQMAEVALVESGVVFLATALDPASVVFACHPDVGIDAGVLLKEALVKVGGRGGGSASLAQGRVPQAELLDSVIELLTSGQ
jgi:alanyl-tRNA synthetase